MNILIAIVHITKLVSFSSLNVNISVISNKPYKYSPSVLLLPSLSRNNLVYLLLLLFLELILILLDVFVLILEFFQQH